MATIDLIVKNGIATTGSYATTGSTITVASASGITAGMFVMAPGIVSGTKVVSIASNVITIGAAPGVAGDASTNVYFSSSLNTVVKSFQYHPPPSVSGKICEAYLDFASFVETDPLQVTVTWTPLFSTNVSTSDEITGPSKILGVINKSTTGLRNPCYFKIPDGPHELTVTISSLTDAFKSGVIGALRIGLRPTDGNNHYEKLVSSKSGPMIII